MNSPEEQGTSANINHTVDDERRESPGISIFRKPAIRYSLVFGGIVGLIAAALFVYTNRPITVAVASVERNVPVRVFGLGTIEARVRSSVGFEVGGRLAELNVDHGDRVVKGSVLARLSPGEQEAKVSKATAAVTIAEANIKKSQANLRKARAIVIQKKEANRRKQALASRNMISREAAEDAQREEDVAMAEASVAIAETDVASAFLSDASAQLQFEQSLLGQRTLVAPYDAIVIERLKELGTVVKPGDPLFGLVSVGTYWGLAYVDEARAGYIRQEQKVQARLRSRPQQTFSGTVARIGLESDRVTEERRVFIAGDNPPAQIFLGEQAEFWINVAMLEQALLIPEAAVRRYDGVQGLVWTLESGGLQRRTVKLGHRTEDGRLEIVGGLPDGAKVITQVGKGFREGRSARAADSGQ